MQSVIRQLLVELGEDPEREGLARTPHRVAKAYEFLTSGYHADITQVLNGALFSVDYSEMVIVQDIDYYSLCEHHLLPFFGAAHVAYVPNGRVIGLSKIPRVVEMYARRLQVQERMTQQVADFLMERLAPKGVGVVMDATHLCAAMRGIRKPGTVMTTAAVLGLFRRNDKTRAEFFAHIGRPSPGA
jgi:GTP cyclohydrolase I